MSASTAAAIDLEALDLGSTRHRPADRATLRAAAVELQARGLTSRDIAAALRLTDAAARDLLEVAP
ncbi:MAG: hypothetical protein M0038_06810 [Pseudomonadota bacterium]|jgi:hypothetical protein|nr:hypothetical protein [Pseudomonadota bacterium]